MGRSNMTDWLRVVFGAGLLLTEPKGRDKIRDRVRDRMSDFASTAQDQYDSVTDRLGHVADAIQDKTDWMTPAIGFLAGVGVGVGLGLLFAPLRARILVNRSPRPLRRRASVFAVLSIACPALVRKGDPKKRRLRKREAMYSSLPVFP
jgi:hypothetical protein